MKTIGYGGQKRETKYVYPLTGSHSDIYIRSDATNCEVDVNVVICCKDSLYLHVI
jgi:hypothetical protein